MTTAYLNRIATAVPAHDIHHHFARHARTALADEPRRARLFERMIQRCGIAHRYSFLAPDHLSAGGFYAPGGFPDTAARMRAFERYAPALARTAVERLLDHGERRRVTHLLTTCCTGFSAPGLDQDVIEQCGLPRGIERTMVGFMGCYAAINALKLARHIVRSEPDARVLILNIELCTLHFQETGDLEQMLSFLIFADGCAAALVTGEADGVALDGFRTLLIPETRDLITWTIRESGFDMVLSGGVPNAIQTGLHAHAADIVGGAPARAIDLWAVHPGGRTVLDAVERAFGLDEEALAASRAVLRDYGNMSSATVMFVLDELLRAGARGAKGCAMSFGPGLSAEIMAFRAREVPDFSRRSQVAEWLDTAAPERRERAAYLESLAWFNGMMLGHRPILSWLKAVARGASEPLTLMDVGCGHGDLLRAIRRWSRARGVPLRLIGVDVEADTVAIAQEATAPDDGIEYLAADVFNLRPGIRIDFVVSSLLVHHFTDDRICAFVRWMEATAQRGWLICDLERHPVPYYAIGATGRLTGIHPMVIKDGRISVTRALARVDWRPTIAAAGLDPESVRLSWFLYRLALSRLKA